MSAFDAALAGLSSACLYTFGEPATFTPAGGGAGIAIRGVRTNPKTPEVASPGQQLVFWIRLADVLPHVPAAGAKITIGAVQFDVIDVEAELDGTANLTLSKA